MRVIMIQVIKDAGLLKPRITWHAKPIRDVNFQGSACPTTSSKTLVMIPLSPGEQDPEVMEALNEGRLRDELNEVLLLHGLSSLSIAQNILVSGLSGKYVGSGAGYRFGKGIYLAGVHRPHDLLYH